MENTADINSLKPDCGRSAPTSPHRIGIHNQGQVVHQQGMFARRQGCFSNGRDSGTVGIDGNGFNGCFE
jgi:hypothetical protein